VTHSTGPRRPGGAGRRRGASGRDRGRWPALSPAAALAVAVTVALTVTGCATNEGGASSPAAATAGPGYYAGWTVTGAPGLVVTSTSTGKAIATVKAPAGVAPGAVYGAAADNRTFVVTGERGHGPDARTAWYLLRVSPGSADPAPLTPLPVPVRPRPAGVALSPDGTQVAVAWPGHPATLRVYSTATGTLLREWSTTAPGELMAAKVPAGGSWPYTALVLRWSADGRQLAFAWNAATIRVLDATAPDGDLIGGSRPLTAIGTTYATLSSFTCQAAHGWQLITVTKGAAAGQGVVCAGSSQTGRYTACTSPTDTKCAYTQRNFIGFLRVTHDSQDATYQGMEVASECPSPANPDNTAYLGWANTDGSVIIGSEICAGHARFGIFNGGGGFTPLPALPMSPPGQAGVLDGTFAW